MKESEEKIEKEEKSLEIRLKWNRIREISKRRKKKKDYQRESGKYTVGKCESNKMWENNEMKM